MNIHLPATHLSAHPSLPGKHHLVSCWESWSNLGRLLSRTKAAQCTQQCSGLIPGLQVPLSALCSLNTWGSILPGTTSQVSSIFQEALLADLHKFEPEASKQSKPQNLREKLTLLYSKHMLFLAHTLKHSKNWPPPLVTSGKIFTLAHSASKPLFGSSAFGLRTHYTHKKSWPSPRSFCLWGWHLLILTIFEINWEIKNIKNIYQFIEK